MTVLQINMFGYELNYYVMEKIHYDQEFLQVDQLSK